jgi:hypothetical protein
MPIPTLFSALSTTANSNSPQGSETPQQIDDHLRQIYAFLKSIFDNSGNGWTSPYAVGNALNASNLTSGVVPSARLPQALQSANSGTYTPVLTAVENCSNLIERQCQWARIGNVVLVSGRFARTSGGAGSLAFRMSLPVVSNFDSSEKLGGTAAQDTSIPGPIGDLPFAVVADPATDSAKFVQYDGSSASTRSYSFSFMYLVI